MTTVEYMDISNDIKIVEEVYRIEPAAFSGEETTTSDSERFRPFELTTAGGGEYPHDTMMIREHKILTELEKQQYEILSVKSELITHRRHKRRMAKELKKRSKYINS